MAKRLDEKTRAEIRLALSEGMKGTDAKGKLTPEYVIKRKLMLYRLGIKVVEV